LPQKFNPKQFCENFASWKKIKRCYRYFSYIYILQATGSLVRAWEWV